MSILANIHPGLLELYFVSIINYISDYPIAVLGEFFCNLIWKKKSKNKVLCCYSNESKVTLLNFHFFPLPLWFWAFFQYFTLFCQQEKKNRSRGRGGQRRRKWQSLFNLFFKRIWKRFCGDGSLVPQKTVQLVLLLSCTFTLSKRSPLVKPVACLLRLRSNTDTTQADRANITHWYPGIPKKAAVLLYGQQLLDRHFSSGPIFPCCYRTDCGSRTLCPHLGFVLGWCEMKASAKVSTITNMKTGHRLVTNFAWSCLFGFFFKLCSHSVCYV